MNSQKKQNRKTAPKVMNGKVQKKNNHDLTKTYWNTSQLVPIIDKEDPGMGFKHFLTKKEILEFIDLIPDWNELSNGLNGILLSRGYSSTEGLHSSRHGVIEICAWPRDMWVQYSPNYYFAHKKIFERLGIDCEKKNKNYLCKFDVRSIKAYLLLHIFLHELGHHHDMMTTKSKIASRGEKYAEEYALSRENEIWEKYFKRF